MLKTITFHPSRIGCPSIPGTMKGMILSIQGVKEAKVRYQDRSLDITFDDTQTSQDEIIKRIGQEMGLALKVGKVEGAKEGGVGETCPM